MNWKFVVLAGGAILLLWTAVSSADRTASDRAAWRQDYRRPADIPFPEENPYSPAKAELGRMLFFDPILSGSQSRSCASCHDPALSWGDGLPRAVGERQMEFRTPTLIDIAWVPRPGWTGKFRDLEAVAFAPIASPAAMNLSEAEALERLAKTPRYVRAFALAFGDGAITRRNVELALATFQRTIVAGDAPFDRWIMGDESAIDDAAKRGFDLFNGKAQCDGCHSGPAFTDGSFHDIGTAEGDDISRGRLFPNATKLRYAFKTPTLRDVARRAPYMHNGSIATLDEVIALYDRGGIDRPSRSNLIRPLKLTPDEKRDLIAFLHTLTGPSQPVGAPALLQ